MKNAKLTSKEILFIIAILVLFTIFNWIGDKYNNGENPFYSITPNIYGISRAISLLVVGVPLIIISRKNPKSGIFIGGMCFSIAGLFFLSLSMRNIIYIQFNK